MTLKINGKLTPKGKKIRKFSKVVLILIIAISVLKYSLSYINPMFEEVCEIEARSVATLITNEESTKVIRQYTYEELFTIERDNDGNVSVIKSNVYVLNDIISDIAARIQEELNNEEKTTIRIPLGSFFGNNLLAGFGPDVKIKIKLAGTLDTEVSSEFISQGINQTLHRVYLNIDCLEKVITPVKTIKRNIVNQVLLVENVIVGKIPDTYYNLEGFETPKDTVDVIK